MKFNVAIRQPTYQCFGSSKVFKLGFSALKWLETRHERKENSYRSFRINNAQIEEIL